MFGYHDTLRPSAGCLGVVVLDLSVRDLLGDRYSSNLSKTHETSSLAAPNAFRSLVD
jgi:hypothetical protein